MLAAIFATPGLEADRAAVAALLAVAVGILCLVARVLKLGVLANFLSRPILTGFFAGISLSIMVGQIGRLTGVKIESDGLLRPLLELAGKAGMIHWPSLALGAGLFLVLQAVRITKLPVPGPVVVVVLAVLLSAVFNLGQYGIAVVGDIPTDLPRFVLPAWSGLPLDLLVTGSAAIFLVSFGSGLVTARSFATLGGQEVDADQELTGFGAANIAAGFFGGFPVTGADSRTAVNVSVGGRSQVVSLAAAVALVATLLFLGPALRILPIPALGAILVAAALGLIDIAGLRQLFRISRVEFFFALVALAGPLSLGVLQGIVIAVGATLVYMLYKSSRPRIAMLGRIAGRDGFYKLHRSPKARPTPGLALCIVQGSLLFFNTDNVRADLRRIASELPDGTEWLVLDASAVSQVDSTSAAMLTGLADEFAGRGIALALAELHNEAKELLERAGVIDRIGPQMVFDDLDDALRAFEARRLSVEPLPASS